MAKNKPQKLVDYYQQLLEIYQDLQQEAVSLSSQEKKIHQEILSVIDQKKIQKLKKYIVKIKE